MTTYLNGEHNGGVYNSKNIVSYGYCYQNPVILVDPNGKQAFFMHGTWSDENFMSSNVMSRLKDQFKNKHSNLKAWSGTNSHAARVKASKEQFEFVKANRKEGESITLIGHSHGGNVAILTASMFGLAIFDRT